MCQRASTFGVESSVPGRRPTGPLPSSSPANKCVPQSPQNHFGFPVAGRQTRSSSKPSAIASAARGTRATRLEDCPERIWQRLQWQRPASVNGGVTRNRTAPHRQQPLSRSSDGAMTVIVRTLGWRAQARRPFAARSRADAIAGGDLEGECGGPGRQGDLPLCIAHHDRGRGDRDGRRSTAHA
jgi:hypothetical protein